MLLLCRNIVPARSEPNLFGLCRNIVPARSEPNLFGLCRVQPIFNEVKCSRYSTKLNAVNNAPKVKSSAKVHYFPEKQSYLNEKSYLAASATRLPCLCPITNQTEQTDRLPALVSPLRHISVTSPFGYHRDPFTKRKALHNGLDLKANYEPAYAMIDRNTQLQLYFQITDSVMQKSAIIYVFFAIYRRFANKKTIFQGLRCYWFHVSCFMFHGFQEGFIGFRFQS